MKSDVAIIFGCLFVLTLIILFVNNIIRKKLPKLFVFFYFIVLIAYFSFLYCGQDSLNKSIIYGTSSIGNIKKVEDLKPFYLQYKVTVELKDKYKKMYNAKEATYNLSQNELKELELKKSLKKGSKIKQIKKNSDSYKHFIEAMKGLRTVINLFAASIIICMAFFLVVGLPRGWDSTIILIIKFLSIIIALIYFINYDLKSIWVIYELVLFYTISEFLFDIKKWYFDNEIKICFRICPGYLKANSKYVKKDLSEELLLSELKRENNLNED